VAFFNHQNCQKAGYDGPALRLTRANPFYAVAIVHQVSNIERIVSPIFAFIPIGSNTPELAPGIFTGHPLRSKFDRLPNRENRDGLSVSRKTSLKIEKSSVKRPVGSAPIESGNQPVAYA